ncbi:MAG: sigma-70 family RNA polymerase sigma factor [Bacteroidota bacterium]
MLTTINDQDREFLEGLLQADRLWVDRWYQEFFGGILQYVRNQSGNRQDAEDIFQDALLIIYQKLKREELQLSATLRTYLLAVCRNLWRSRRRSHKEFSLQEGEGEQLPDPAADIESVIHRRSREKLYQLHFSQLGERCQQILQLFFAKVKLAEIAQQLGLSANYVKKKKFSCKEKLIESIQADPSYQELQK